MKLVSFQPASGGTVRVGVVGSNGTVIDVAAASGGRLPGGMLAFLAAGDAAMAGARELAATNAKPAYAMADVRLHAPVPRPGKILHTSCNFMTHLDELTGWRAPEWQAHNWGSFHYDHPTGFLEAPSCVVGPDATIYAPVFTKQLDFEIEIGIVIGKTAKNVPVEKAAEYIAGYTIFNDVSARDIQAREHANKVILLGKSFDGSCPFGPSLVTTDELGLDPDLPMVLTLNGEVRQDARTSHMRFPPSALVSWWSLMTLEPGDIITSGSPPGVIAGMENPQWLKPGDRIDARIDGIGTLTTFIGDAP